MPLFSERIVPDLCSFGKTGLFFLSLNVIFISNVLEKIMKAFILLFILPIISLQAFAFEGVFEYNIHSGDRDWRMECFVKGDFLKAKIYLGETHYQSILNNSEGHFVLDELNRHIFPAEFVRPKWGKKDEKMRKPEVPKFKRVGPLDKDGFTGEVYSVKFKRRIYHIQVIEGMGELPGVFLDQFSSLKGIAVDGGGVFKETKGIPLSIFELKKKDEPILRLISSTPQTIDDEIFIIPDNYVRAKMRFRMR